VTIEAITVSKKPVFRVPRNVARAIAAKKRIKKIE
jgi:hypothetical protein